MDYNLLENSMQKLQKGNIDALRDIYKLTSKAVYYLSYYILKSAERAKDIVQETYISVFKNIQKYKLNTSAMAWITSIARNLSISEYRKKQRDLSLEIFEESLLDESDYCEFVENNIYLKNALNILNAGEREIVILFAVDCFKHREIAQIVNKPLGTVQWVYNNAIKKLRKKVESELDDNDAKTRQVLKTSSGKGGKRDER